MLCLQKTALVSTNAPTTPELNRPHWRIAHCRGPRDSKASQLSMEVSPVPPSFGSARAITIARHVPLLSALVASLWCPGSRGALRCAMGDCLVSNNNTSFLSRGRAVVSSLGRPSSWSTALLFSSTNRIWEVALLLFSKHKKAKRQVQPICGRYPVVPFPSLVQACLPVPFLVSLQV